MQTSTDYKPTPFMDLIISLLIPTFILMKQSGPDDLGPTNALIIALAFPISWGLYQLFRFRHFNFIALLGLISVLLTGGIGLLKLDTQWLAIKEAAIPGLIGLGVFISTFTRYPLVKTFIFSPKVFNIDIIKERLEANNNSTAFEKRLQNANILLSGTFAFSSVVNYILAVMIVTSPAGTPEFNEQLGQMNLISYPVIALPSTIMMMGILYFLWRTINGLTGLKFEEIVAQQDN